MEIEKKMTPSELLDIITLAEKSVEYWKEKNSKAGSNCPNCLKNLSISRLKVDEYYEKALDILLNS